jgi:hypothetical protein
VAETKTALEKSGLTRGKAALIGVLSVVLACVMYLQYGRSSDDDSSPASTAESASPRAVNSATTESTTAAGTVSVQQENAVSQSAVIVVDEKRWEAPDLAEVVGYDPFALPSSFPQPVAGTIDPRLAEVGMTEPDANELAEALEKLQTQLKELQERGVHVIVKQRDEYVAMIGDRTLHVGDEINGFTVTAIGPNGVSVERKTVE